MELLMACLLPVLCHIYVTSYADAIDAMLITFVDFEYSVSYYASGACSD